ncbi:MAG: hypothetical protein V4773_04080, partial [Verrucomicrobiota bacterium]
MSRPAAIHVSPFRRFLAALSAALVLALTLISASPAAHEWLHQVEQHHTCQHHHAPVKAKPAATADSEHDCAVVLFASGVDLPVAPLALTPPSAVVDGISAVTAAE